MFNCYYYGRDEKIMITTNDEELMEVILNFMHQRIIISAKDKNYENTKLYARYCEDISCGLDELRKDKQERNESEVDGDDE